MKDYMLSRKRMRRFCAELTEGDGLDPRKSLATRLGRSSSHGPSLPSADRKVLQLCHQVLRTLDEVFADCRDDLIRGLRVIAVEPAPDAARLLVTVLDESREPVDGIRSAEIIDHLERASGHLRAEVAHAITRKRAPLLFYRLAATIPQSQTA